MNSKINSNKPRTSESWDFSFIAKMKGALIFSGKSFFLSYKSKKLWHGYFIALICMGLFSLVLGTSTLPILTDLFPHLVFSIGFFGVVIWISFSPLIFLLSFFALCILWLFVSVLVSYFKRLQLKRTLSALAFALTPQLILIFYLVNKFILQSFKYELGPLLLGIALGWSVLSAFIGVTSLIGFDFGGLLNYAIKSIIFRKKRTYAAIIGITVAVGLIVTPFPIISGYYSQLNYLAGQNQYAQYLIALEKGENNYYSSYVDESILNSLYHSNIQVISPETYLNISFSYQTTTFQSNLRGINYSIFKSFRNSVSFQILPGRQVSGNNILIGNILASLLNISYAQLPINVTLTHTSKMCNATVIGVINSNIQYDMEFLGALNLTQILKPELIDKFSLIEMKLKDPLLIDSTIQTLRAENPNLDIERENQLSDFVLGIISRTIQSLWYLSIVVYIAMAFGMYHIIQTIIKESEREIAILKSIGSSRSQIVRLYLYQTILFCLIGSVLGVLSGMILSYGASFIVSNITTLIVQPTFDVLSIGLAIFLSLVVGIIGSLYPAYSASKKLVGRLKQ